MAAEFDFTLSHSAELAALVISRSRRFCVDIERHREMDHLGMAERVLLPAEPAVSPWTTSTRCGSVIEIGFRVVDR
ncbi:hypothetical protein [Allokutzneria oryzae]|uniref:4'-phosphopantetheinyl transferase domain-containing protein n=1 Tax=Allokutzneria oryzae TaxID=1378989 RepID=A0ABV5ZPT7_9PSEU